jgi:LysM repeat protein
MRQIAFIAAVFAAASVFAAGNSHKVHAAPLQHTQNTNFSTVHTASAQTSRYITVQSGDNLTKLANIYESTAARLFYANTQIQNPNLIYPAEKLRVPTASEQLTPRPMPGDSVASSPAPKVPIDESAAVAPAAAPAPHIQKPIPAVTVPSVGTSVWDRLADCESSGNWSTNTGNGFYGGLQFTLSSWQAVGGSGYPNYASKSEQIARAQKLQAVQGWGAWPACSIKLGLR